MTWRDIKFPPSSPCPVLFFHENLWKCFPTEDWKKLHVERGQDIRYSTGYWDGTDWRELFTGHLLFDGSHDPDGRPTHWQRLYEPLTAAVRRNTSSVATGIPSHDPSG